MIVVVTVGVNVRRYGVSKRLFEEFLRPLLLVGLFAPAEELSAAVMIGTLYFYGKPHIIAIGVIVVVMIIIFITVTITTFVVMSCYCHYHNHH